MLDRNAVRSDLEQWIDSIGLRAVLELLSEVCHEKADHLRVNWQDESAAKGWERDARRIEACAGKVEV